MDQANLPAVPPARVPHADGWRVAEMRQGDEVALVLCMVAGNAIADSATLLVFADDPDGRAELSRVRPLCEAIASYMSYGGDLKTLVAVTTVLGAACTTRPVAVDHVLTVVEAKRKHVLRHGDGFLLVVEDEATEAIDEGQLMAMVAGAEYDRFVAPHQEDDWSFLDEMAGPKEDADGGTDPDL